jgi:glutathione S-transferase
VNRNDGQSDANVHGHAVGRGEARYRVASRSVDATIYRMGISHPARAAELMLAYKGIEARKVEIPPGSQKLLMRRYGFRGGTVPGLKLGDRRVQGSHEIALALEEAQPEPPLFPADPKERAKVEQAALWGERTYQPVPRRIFRWAVSTDSSLRTEMAKTLGVPLPGVTQALMWPVAQLYLRDEGGGERQARRDVAELPDHLEKVDALISAGVLGGDRLNAADFQIATTTRVLLNFAQLRPLIEDRPAGAHANRVAPTFGREIGVRIPEEWLP